MHILVPNQPFSCGLAQSALQLWASPYYSLGSESKSLWPPLQLGPRQHPSLRPLWSNTAWASLWPEPQSLQSLRLPPASVGKDGGDRNVISGELQYFAFSNPVQVVTSKKGESRPTCGVDKNPHYIITPMHCIYSPGMIINGPPVPLKLGDGGLCEVGRVARRGSLPGVPWSRELLPPSLAPSQLAWSRVGPLGLPTLHL